jgi:hypothetical protein
MRKNIYLCALFVFILSRGFAQDYTFDDFVGTWHGYISSITGGYDDTMTMTIFSDGFYAETSGHLMPTTYPNTQQCDYDAATNRMHWWYLYAIYEGQYFYQNFYYEVVHFSNDTLEMYYNYWDDTVPHPDVGTIFLVHETITGLGDVVLQNKPERKLLHVFDLTGREADPMKKGTVLIYQYSDGTVEKRYNSY